MLDKEQLRQQMLQQREAMPLDDRLRRSGQLIDNLHALPVVREAPLIFCFVSCRSEIETHELIQRWLVTGKTVAVPMIVGHSVMHAHRITSLKDLVPGKLGILAPRHPDPIDALPDITCCPGLAFTERGERLGLGGGYYDRYLSAHPETVSVGLCFATQVLPEIPCDETDRIMRYIATDERVIDCGSP